jgi:psiF repeat
VSRETFRIARLVRDIDGFRAENRNRVTEPSLSHRSGQFRSSSCHFTWRHSMRIFAAAAAILTLSASCAFAQTAAPANPPSQQDRMRACNADARNQRLTGNARKSFMSTCLSGAAPSSPGTAAVAPPTAAPNPPASTAASPASPPAAARPTTTGAAARPLTPGQRAERTRMQRCGQEWQANKAAGRNTAGQTWPQYWSACNTRLKAGGQ